MSNLEKPVHCVAVYDTESNYLLKDAYVITKGAKNCLYRSIIASSNSSTSANWSNCDPPSSRNIIGRAVQISVKMRLTVNGTTSNGENIVQTGSWGVRPFAINNAIGTATVTLNSRAFTTSTNEYLNMLLWYNNEFNMRERFASTTADYKLKFQHFEDGLYTNNNPLAGYNDSTSSDRGNGDILITSYVNTPTNAVIEFILTENLLVSPLAAGPDIKKGLTKINNMSVQINWDSNLVARMLAFAQLPTHTYSSIALEFAEAPQLLFRYLEPSMVESIPKTIYYNVNRFNTYITNAGTLAPGASANFQSDNFSIGYIPTKIYVAVRRTVNDMTVYNSENYASIDNISLVWDTKNVLSNATRQQLFSMANANGYSGTYADFSQQPRYLTSGVSNTKVQGNGCVLCFTLDTSNLGVGVLDCETQAVGLGNERFQFYYKVTATNCSRDTVNYNLYTVLIEPGVMTVDDNMNILENYGPINELDVMNAPIDPNMHLHTGPDYAGSGFFDSLKNIVGKVGQVATAALNNPVVGPLIKTGIKGLVGMGYEDPTGGSFVGGARMPHHAMRHRLR